MGDLSEMDVYSNYFVLCLCLGRLVVESVSEPHVKIWKPNNAVLNKDNWVNPDSKEDCGIVEFAEFNEGYAYIDALTAKEFLLPVSGNIEFMMGGYMRVVDDDSKEKTNCFKLKPFDLHLYFDPRNWDSDVANNPAVPDREKLPCRDDHIKFPNEKYSSMSGMVGDHIVSAVTIGNLTVNWTDIVDVNPQARLVINKRKCFDPAGCLCNDEAINCPPAKELGCLDPVHPKEFCHPICGAYVTFKPAPGFSLKMVRDALKDYSEVYTHASKVDDDLVQVVFAEKEYTGDSVRYAEEFYEELKEKSGHFKITDLQGLKKAGSQTNGSSFFTVLFLSLIFVLAIFCTIFCVYGDRRWLTNFRLRNPASYPLSSTYRARFSSRDDESGLIFDTQSIAGSVLNLRQSFDNPMFNEGMAVKDDAEKKIDNSGPKIPEDKPIENNDPLFDLKKLNEELQEEIGADIVEDLQKAIAVKTALVNDVEPLIEVDEEEYE